MTIFDLRLATAADIAEVIAMRDAAAHWQIECGITQWIPGELDKSVFEGQVDRGELWVAGSTGSLVASVRLLWSDVPIWPDEQDSGAGYVHQLVVRTRGQGLGSHLLRWVQERIISSGGSLVRLDCVSSNAALRAYYRGQGFDEVGEFPLTRSGTPSLTKFERRVGGVAG